jgi:hypothetical protein
MKAIRSLIILAALACAAYQAYSQPPEEFYNPKIDYFWIAMLNYDTVPGDNGSGPAEDPGEDGNFYAYVDEITQLPWFNTWFYNGPLNLNNMKKVRMGFWVQRLFAENPAVIWYVINWSNETWPPGQGFPGPADEEHILRSPTQMIQVPISQPPLPGTWVEVYFEIPNYNPEWVSVDVWGDNIMILEEPLAPPPESPLFYWWNYAIAQGMAPKGGLFVHECLPKVGNLDFGDAPEGDTAYLYPVVIGNFPTCTQVGPQGSFISHQCPSNLFFGALVDCELDGNAGLCPTFGPNLYNWDECGNFPYPIPPIFDDGLMKPVPNTIGLIPNSFWGYFACGGVRQSLGLACGQALWGANIDIWLNGVNPQQASPGFFNLLVDWNQDGDWLDVVQCAANQLPEHVIVDFPIPAGFTGPISQLPVPPFTIGPNGGYVWARFSLTESPVGAGWDGTGTFFDGETEDYLLYTSNPASIPVSNWSVILVIALIAVFTILYFVRKR